MIKLFCLPYAGGSATVYTKWKKSLNGMIQLCPIELAGRGKRFTEGFYNNLDEAIDDIFRLVKNELDRTPYALFGHSMGALLVYELVKKIAAAGYREPVHVFLSGRYPPHIMKNDKLYHQLSDTELKAEILKMGGTPREVLEHQELLDIFIPLIRADYKILETYRFIPSDFRFSCGITLFNGKADEEVPIDELREWQRYTKADCRIYEYEGGHFFIHDKMEDIVQIINDTLIQLIIDNGTGKTVLGF